MNAYNNTYHLTRGTKTLIEDIVKEMEQSGENVAFNRYAICDKIADIICEKYKGNALDYQIERMNIQTTGKILQAIDTYFYKHHR